MNLSGKHIILVNFDFPPNYGIGGRRWGKFAKEIASRGIHVHVIKAKPKDNRLSQWTKDVKSEFIHIYEFERKADLDRYSVGISLIDSILYRVALWINCLREAGTPFDLAISNKKGIHSLLNELTNKYPIEWIVATGAPFNLLYYCALFVEKNPSLKLWADLRDPWLDAKNYGFANLSPKRKSSERAKAILVLDQAKIISGPTYAIVEMYEKERQGLYASKLLELRHFYDPDDQKVKSELADPEKLTIVYGGDFYPGSEQFVCELIQDLRKLKREDVDLYNRISIRLYSDNYAKVSCEYSDVEVVSFQPSVGDKIFEEMAKADWCLILLSDFNRHFFTTKYFDYQPLGKPYLYLGPEGNVAKEITEQQAGLRWSDFLEQVKLNGWIAMKQFQRGEKIRSGSLKIRTDELLKKMSEFH